MVLSQGNTSYIYKADGQKVKKIFGTQTTDYLDSFQYQNGVLQFFPTSEGFYNVERQEYVFNYTDHLGNVRLSYSAADGGGIALLEENNYYPFGLKHEGYNSGSMQLTSYTYGFQGQERQKETGWSSFKWRNAIPELGRFFNIDPLSEKYPYQSHYNFAENRVVDGRELEGLEWVRSVKLNQDGTKTHTLNADIKLVNASQNFTSQNMKDFQTSYVNNMNNSYNGLLSNGDKMKIGIISFETVNSVKDGDYSTSIVDKVLDTQGNPVTFNDGSDVKGMIQLDGKDVDPVNDYMGNSQQNNMQVVPSGKNATGETGAHETGHTFGLRHNTDDKNSIKSEVKIPNLMHAPQMDNGIIPKQRDIIIQNVPEKEKK